MTAQASAGAGPIKVALVTPRFPPAVGGLEEYVGWVARTLHSEGSCDVTVITTSASRRTHEEEYHGIPVHRLGTWFTLSNTPINPLWIWQLRRLLGRLDVDVVNAHAPVPGLADLAAFTAAAPVVLTYHAGSLVKGGSPADPLLRAYERHVLPRVFARSERLLAVSPVSAAHGTGRAELVPPGVDTSLFVPPADTAGRGQRVLYVGRVERTSRWKGLHVLVGALARLREVVPDARLEIVGDGDDVPALKSRADLLGVGDAIDWRGAVEHDRLPEIYGSAGVTVLPSLTEAESFGMTLAEAMACACPVVASAVGGIPFVVRDGVDGLLVPPGDEGALADALARVLTDPERAAELGNAGREAARSRWDWTHQAERTVQVIANAARPAESQPTGVVSRAMGLAERVRGRIPRTLLPVVVTLRFLLAWSRSAVRRDAREQMAFLMEKARPEAKVAAAARAYALRQIWRGELRWHPELITHLRVVGMEHVDTARAMGCGVMLNFVHHGTYEGALASVGHAGAPAHMVVHPYMVRPDAARWLQQHMRVACSGGGRPVSAEIGTQGIKDLLARGEVVAMASDVPGRTHLTFAGREVLGSFGAARIAADTGAPVIVMTYEHDESGPYVRLHEPLDPKDFDGAEALLREMIRRHEVAVLKAPEATDLPLSRWGQVAS